MADGQSYYSNNSGGAGGGYMGGTPGDSQVFGTQTPGYQPQQQQQQYGMPQQTPATPGGYNNNSAAVQNPAQQQQQAYPAGSGSITRFATPQQQPGTPLYPPQTSPYNFAPPPQPGNSNSGSNNMASGAAPGAGAGMSFAQRSAMLQQPGGSYGQQQQQPQQQAAYGKPPQQQFQQQQPPQQQPPPTPPAAGGMSFAQRSQMMQEQQQRPSNVYGSQQQQQQQQPPQQSNAYIGASASSNNVYGGAPPAQHYPQPGTPQRPTAPQPSSGASGTLQPHQQQPPQPPHQYGGVAPQPCMGGPPQQPQPGMGQPQQPNNNMAGSSYAQRSAAAGMGSSYSGVPQQGMQPQPGMVSQPGLQPQPGMQRPGMPQQQPQQMPLKPNIYADPPEVIAQQNRLLTEATRKVQEHAYYMKQAMETNDLPTVLDRAASMVSELGEHAHAHHHHQFHPPAPGATGSTTALSPKNYYELHLRALEELPTLEDYLLNIAQNTNTNAAAAAVGSPAPTPMMSSPTHMMMGGPTNQQPPPMSPPTPGSQTSISYTMMELYDCVQYGPNVLSRLYLQICAASALTRSGQVGARWVLKDMIEAVKCVQNPVRGLFLRHYLLQAFRDKHPDAPIRMDEVANANGPATSSPGDSKPAAVITATDVPSAEKGTVKDSYEFILANFIEMNKLWVRIQHLPGDGRSKDMRRRREKDRNELRVLVGTNLVRLAALDSITSTIYGQVILPTVLDHIVVCADPLAQAYLIDCIVQVFPDEYHIETMPILLGVCPKLRDKVNVRTILQSLMDRLANYLADEELLDEKDSNQVKRNLATDSFNMFDECVQTVYNARGPKLQAKEVLRLQTALLSFSMKCYQGNLEQVTLCLNHCVLALHQASANQALMQDGQPEPPAKPQLDQVATKELETLLSIPLEELALGVLNLDHYAELISFLPWTNRRQLALTMLEAVNKTGTSPDSVKEIEELFLVNAPVLRDEHDSAPTPLGFSDATERTASLMANLGVSPCAQRSFSEGTSFHEGEEAIQYEQDAALVSKLIHLLDHSNTDVLYEMLTVARHHLNSGKRQRTNPVYVALVFAGLKLAKRILVEEIGEVEPTKLMEESKTDEPEEEKTGKGESDKLAKNDEDEEKVATEDVETTPEDTKVETVEGGATEEEAKPAEEKSAESSESKIADLAKKVVSAPKTISCRKVFIFVQQTISALAKGSPEKGVKLYLEAALTADKFAARADKQASGKDAFGQIAYELISQSFALYEEHTGDSKLQSRCIVAMIGTLLACRAVSKEDYESLIMKTCKYAAKMLKKPDQCEMVALCSHLFYVVGEEDAVVYSNPQRGLECLQRALKLADACTSTNPANLQLFVDLLDHYLFFFEKKNPAISGNYITGLVALIKEHTDSLGPFGGVDASTVGEAKSHFVQIVQHIKRMQGKEETKERFGDIDVSSITT